MAATRLIDLKNCVIKFVDGAGTPEEYTVKLGQGTLSYTEQRPREYVGDRGKVATGFVSDGDEVPMTLSLQAAFTEVRSSSGGSDPTLNDVLDNVNDASGWVTTGNACEPYCIDLVVVHTPPCPTGKIETFTFPQFRYDDRQMSFSDKTITIGGACKAISPTIVLTDQS